MAIPLLQTKPYIPPIRADLVSRLLIPACLIAIALWATACRDPSRPASPQAPPQVTATPPPGSGQTTVVSSTAQVPLPLSAGQRVRFEHISVEQGLSQTTVFCILQDSAGFMWFGTEDGLNKYDSYTFTVFKHDPQDPGSIGDNWIQSIYQDRSGVLWVGTLDGGLDRFDREKQIFYHYQHDPQDPHSLSTNEVTAIYEDRTGTLWVGTRAGLDRLVPGLDPTEATFAHYRHDPANPDSLSAGAVLSIHGDREGALWIGTDGGGLDRLDRATERFDHYRHDPADPYSLSHNTVRAIHHDRQGVLWVGTDAGLDRLDREHDRFVRYQHDPNDPHSLAFDQVRSIFENEQGVLWIGTWGGGLDRFDRETQRFIHYAPDPDDAHGVPESMNLDRIWSVYQDRSGALWIGTDSQGLAWLDVASWGFAHYQHDPGNPNSLANNYVRGIFQDRSGSLWIGTEAGLDRFDQNTGQWHHYQHDPGDPNSLNDDNVWAILQDREGMLWVGTRNGLDRFDPATETFTHYRSDPHDPHSLSDNFILPIYQDREGVLWVGTFAGGLDRFDPATQQFTRYQTDPGDPHSLSSDTVMSILEDRAGSLWIGTVGGGLDRLDRDSGRFDHFPSDPNDPHSLSHSLIASVFQDRAGTLWVGTPGGLNRYDPATGRFTRYREKDGLPNDMIYGIVEDQDGFLWLSTNNGLSRFDPQTETFRNFDTSDGLQSSEFNSFSYHQSSSGQIFFGGINGFNAFYPDDVRDNAYLPPVVLTGLTQSGQDVDLGTAVESATEITLQWPNSFFEFEFAALSYIHPEKNQYAYLLEGFDGDWIQNGTSRTGRYTNLPGGTYALLLKGSNNDGVWNETSTAIEVTVVPPFWATLWFRGIALTILIVGSVASYRLRVRNVEARSRDLAAQVEQRTAQLRQESEQRAQAERALQQREMEQAITAERNRLARDLHDSVTQSLYSLTLLAEAGQRMIAAQDLQQIEGNQARLGDIAQQALQEMRLLVYELRPLALDSEGLVGALEQRLETVERRAGVQARVVVQGEIALPSDVEEELYRIAQEALNNALKHARASMVRLTIRAAEDAVVLAVADDGLGFDPETVGDQGGLGLVSMQERAARIGGQLTIQSVPGEGTTIAVKAPSVR